MSEVSGTILVTGATGAQGGATARRLLAAGRRVRLLTRDPRAPAARALAAAGAQVVPGDLGDAASLSAAMRGVQGVFSVQVPDIQGDDSERRHGFALVRAALAQGVRQFVHTSVARAGDHLGFARWDSGYWNRKYWTDKWEIEQAVRAAGFGTWTVLKPAFMMDNFAQPKSRFMFPQLRRGRIVTALHADTRMHLIAADDVGAFAAAAFERPERFNGKSIALAAQALTMSEVAATLARALAKPVGAITVTPDEALAQGLHPGWVRSQEWTNDEGYAVDIDAVKAHGVSLTALDAWARAHRDAIAIDDVEEAR